MPVKEYPNKITQFDGYRITLLFFLYGILLFILTCSPFDFSFSHFHKLLSYSISKKLAIVFTVRVYDVINNILLFIPWGMLLFIAARKRVKKTKISFWMPVLLGFLLSGLIESVQFFLDRYSAFFDILANGMGTVIGFWIMPKLIRLKISHIWKKKGIRKTVFIFYITGLLVLCLIPYYLNSLHNWDLSYPLLLGNEGTLDRPWTGELNDLSFYSTVLTSKQVESAFQRGFISSGDNVKSILSFQFNENNGDTLWARTPTQKMIPFTGHSWTHLSPSPGIAIQKGGRLKNATSIKELIHELSEKSRFSVAFWLRTDDILQTGPARIVSFSVSPVLRNMTLGQNGPDLHFRVRTPMTGKNGSRMVLVASSVLKKGKHHHIAASFHRGSYRLYIDGKPAKEVVFTLIDLLPFHLGLGLQIVSKIVFFILFFFPLGFLAAHQFKTHLFLWGLGVSAIIPLSIQGIYTLLIQQPFDLRFQIGAFLLIFAGTYLGSFFQIQE